VASEPRTPAQEAEHALDNNIHYTRIRKEAQAEYHRIKAERTAEHALANGIPRRQLDPAAQKAWDRLRSARDPGYQPGNWDAHDEAEPDEREASPQAGHLPARTPPEIRERILIMFKKANSKYRKPFDKDRLAAVSVFGGNWEEYGQIILQMAILDTLLSIEEKLDTITSRADRLAAHRDQPEDGG
jgi:hypothetical protein